MASPTAWKELRDGAAQLAGLTARLRTAAAHERDVSPVKELSWSEDLLQLARSLEQRYRLLVSLMDTLAAQRLDQDPAVWALVQEFRGQIQSDADYLSRRRSELKAAFLTLAEQFKQREES